MSSTVFWPKAVSFVVVVFQTMTVLKWPSVYDGLLTLSSVGGGGGGRGGEIRPLLFFFHLPKTVQAIKLKLSDFKDKPLRHFLQVKPVRYILSCCQGNKITKGTSQNLAPKKSEKSVICEAIELKFGTEATFGLLSSKTNVRLELDVIKTSLWRFQLSGPFADESKEMTLLWRHTSKCNKFWNWNQKDNTR